MRNAIDPLARERGGDRTVKVLGPDRGDLWDLKALLNEAAPTSPTSYLLRRYPAKNGLSPGAVRGTTQPILDDPPAGSSLPCLARTLMMKAACVCRAEAITGSCVTGRLLRLPGLDEPTAGNREQGGGTADTSRQPPSRASGARGGVRAGRSRQQGLPLARPAAH
jgi:hypothetical protein